MPGSGLLTRFAALAMSATAAVLALVVVPAVRADPFPGAAPDRAASGFAVGIILHLLLAAQALVASRLDAQRARHRRAWTGAAGVLGLLLGVAMIDAAMAFVAHGPPMRGAVVALWTCVLLDVSGGAAMIGGAFAPRGGHP